MPLTVQIDRSVPALDAQLLVLEVENLPMCQDTPADVSYGDLADDALVKAALQVPGTYDEFPEIFREIAVRHNICPDRVKVVVEPDPDGYE
jgi:hypothetical protein